MHDGHYREPEAYLSSVRYEAGDGTSLDGVDLDIYKGELHVLLGATDSGHGWVLKLLMGLIQPDAGEISIFGGSPTDASVRQRIGASIYQTYPPGPMLVREIVDLVRAHYADARTTDELLEEFEITELADRQAETLSPGEERWLSLALAFAGKPEFVVLDQPTAAMDFDWRFGLWRRLRDYADDGGTVLMSTHVIEEASQYADRVTVIAGGRVVASATPQEVLRQANSPRIRVSVRDPLDLGDQCRIEQSDGIATIYADDVDTVLRQLVRTGVDFSDLTVHRGSLGEAISKLTEDGDR